jgi:hypothetical protein
MASHPGLAQLLVCVHPVCAVGMQRLQLQVEVSLPCTALCELQFKVGSGCYIAVRVDMGLQDLYYSSHVI